MNYMFKSLKITMHPLAIQCQSNRHTDRQQSFEAAARGWGRVSRDSRGLCPCWKGSSFGCAPADEMGQIYS